MTDDEYIVELLNVMETAIRDGDWKVDGACDPELIMSMAESRLYDLGYRRNGITGESWIRH